MPEVRNTPPSVMNRPAVAALAQQGDGTLEARRDLLVRQREQLTARMADMQASLDRLDYKIDLYARRIAQQDRQSPEEHGGCT